MYVRKDVITVKMIFLTRFHIIAKLAPFFRPSTNSIEAFIVSQFWKVFQDFGEVGGKHPKSPIVTFVKAASLDWSNSS